MMQQYGGITIEQKDKRVTIRDENGSVIEIEFIGGEYYVRSCARGGQYAMSFSQRKEDSWYVQTSVGNGQLSSNFNLVNLKQGNLFSVDRRRYHREGRSSVVGMASSRSSVDAYGMKTVDWQVVFDKKTIHLKNAICTVCRFGYSEIMIGDKLIKVKGINVVA